MRNFDRVNKHFYLFLSTRNFVRIEKELYLFGSIWKIERIEKQVYLFSSMRKIVRIEKEVYFYLCVRKSVRVIREVSFCKNQAKIEQIKSQILYFQGFTKSKLNGWLYWVIFLFYHPEIERMVVSVKIKIGLKKNCSHGYKRKVLVK